MGEYAPGEGPQLNRRQRRMKAKNRGFTKKGNTRVIRRDENGQIWNIPTKKGSRIHGLAQHNVKKMHRKKKGGEDAAKQGSDRTTDAQEVSGS